VILPIDHWKARTKQTRADTKDRNGDRIETSPGFD
jgi:hypothetical protein